MACSPHRRGKCPPIAGVDTPAARRNLDLRDAAVVTVGLSLLGLLFELV
ncbi:MULTISPECIES: hypothetical protein [Haloferax]|uniref:Uncharacterized protein n=1 Tax=Haloferax marinisediminis TaxID=2666142 RepID=A0A6G1YXX0_9EURY|nr:MULTISPECIES: hypothetical protein [Haloferax]MRW79189.1 hypothetical protein [Haloferax marinisediminis]